MTEPRPRLLPDEPLPSYAFVPGQNPHPVSDPAGHSFGAAPFTPPALDPEHWETSRDYLHGIDLFNHGYFWESHERWEGLWHAAGRKGATADFLKGLIKLAAAGVKQREGRPAGVRSHSTRAAALWRAVARTLGSDDFFLGFRLQELIDLAESVGQQGWPTTPPFLRPSGFSEGRT